MSLPERDFNQELEKTRGAAWALKVALDALLTDANIVKEDHDDEVRGVRELAAVLAGSVSLWRSLVIWIIMGLNELIDIPGKFFDIYPDQAAIPHASLVPTRLISNSLDALLYRRPMENSGSSRRHFLDCFCCDFDDLSYLLSGCIMLAHLNFFWINAHVAISFGLRRPAKPRRGPAAPAAIARSGLNVSDFEAPWRR